MRRSVTWGGDGGGARGCPTAQSGRRVGFLVELWVDNSSRYLMVYTADRVAAQNAAGLQLRSSR